MMKIPVHQDVIDILVLVGGLAVIASFMVVVFSLVKLIGGCP